LFGPLGSLLYINDGYNNIVSIIDIFVKINANPAVFFGKIRVPPGNNGMEKEAGHALYR
jgi:hypothetical protein